jgi:Ca-activated chloride channel family protein
MKRYICIALLGVMAAAGAAAEHLSIAQIDASSLLATQKVKLYVSITDEQGDSVPGLTAEHFTVYEAPEGGDFSRVPELTSVEERPNEEEGIHILLLIDNSGSMYDTLGGRRTEERDEMRITHAKRAISDFIGSSFNPRDVVSLASFNTEMRFHSEAIRDPSALEGLLESIERPEREKAYTELYNSLVRSVREMAGYRGRKVVVVLSDGENYPYKTHAGEPNPQFGTRLPVPAEVTEEYQKEGITLYAVHFGIEKDRHLGDIALETGGTVYDARNERELAGVYRDIKRKIENEYRLTYRPAMLPAEKTEVKVRYQRGDASAESQRFYYTSTIFGMPVEPFPYLILLLIPAALLLWLLLLVVRFRGIRRQAFLEVLERGYKTRVSSATVPLQQEKTVIGGGDKADLTISGRAPMKEEQATIVRDQKSGSYTIAAASGVTVNNRQVEGTKKLSDGDVVNVEGTTIVFSEPDSAHEAQGREGKKESKKGSKKGRKKGPEN